MREKGSSFACLPGLQARVQPVLEGLWLCNLVARETIGSILCPLLTAGLCNGVAGWVTSCFGPSEGLLASSGLGGDTLHVCRSLGIWPFFLILMSGFTTAFLKPSQISAG